MSEVQGLLDAADALIERAAPETASVWPRAAALLARQALEGAVEELWAQKAPGLARCPMRAQLACLLFYLDEGTAEQASHVWAELSRACHHHAYELPPNADELRILIAGCRAVAAECVR